MGKKIHLPKMNLWYNDFDDIIRVVNDGGNCHLDERNEEFSEYYGSKIILEPDRFPDALREFREYSPIFDFFEIFNNKFVTDLQMMILLDLLNTEEKTCKICLQRYTYAREGKDISSCTFCFVDGAYGPSIDFNSRLMLENFDMKDDPEEPPRQICMYICNVNGFVPYTNSIFIPETLLRKIFDTTDKKELLKIAREIETWEYDEEGLIDPENPR